MYDPREVLKAHTKPTTEEGHVDIAEKMGKEIAGNYGPSQQNEMVKIIRNMVSERRTFEIEELEERLNYLKKSFNEL